MSDPMQLVDPLPSGERNQESKGGDDKYYKNVLKSLNKGSKPTADDLNAKKKILHDFRPDVDAAKKEADALAKAGQLEEAVEVALKVEKKARHASEWEFVIELALYIAELAFAKDWDTYNAHVTMLCKRRQQHRTVVAAVVKAAIPRVDTTPDKACKLALLDCLRTVSEGKIFLEVERARLTRILADMQEADGDLASAAKTLQECHVETYGTMDNKEKVDFILEQIRLCLAVKDYIRANIVAKRIDRKGINEKGLQKLKIKYYKLLVEYHTHEDDALSLCRDFLSLLDTPCIQSDRAQRTEMLSHACLFCVLSEYGTEQWSLLNSVNQTQETLLEEAPAMKSLLKAFLTHEIAPWPLPAGAELLAHPIFTAAQWGERCAQWKDQLKQRVLQHNIRVIARYYTRVTLARLSELCGLSVDEAELAISAMVCVEGDDSEPLYARIDRPAGIVSFVKAQDPGKMLSDWGSDISELLGLVEKTKHLIDREMMAHKAAN